MKADRGSTRVALLVLAVAVLAQGWIALNPGWFSHDELQWAVRADVARLADLPWVGWFDVAQFQFRPLTFNLWLLVSYALFDDPVAWHALWVLAGGAIAAGLAVLLLRLGVAARVAGVAALVFALSPYAVYVHGWVATLADLLVIAIGLALAHALVVPQRSAIPAGAEPPTRSPVRAFVVAALATTAALLAKESAVAFAPVLGLAWLLRPRDRALRAAAVGASLVVVAYLALRLPVLLHPVGAEAYALDVGSAPRNWAAYHLFLPRPATFEPGSLWRASTWTLAFAAALWLTLWALVARVSWRLALAGIGGGALLLAPALPIAVTANQYGYGFALWTCGCVALAWAGLGRGGRLFVGLFAVVVVWHGANVQRNLRAAGERQAVFQPALVAALAAQDGELRLYVDADDAWLYRRLTHEVPSWHAAPIGNRVTWVEARDAAHFVVTDDGHLEKGVGSETEH